MIRTSSSLLLALSLVLALAACSGKDDSGGGTDTTNEDSYTPTNAGRDEICKAIVGCQYTTSVIECKTTYFENCTGSGWSEEAALDCLNSSCYPAYDAGESTCSAYFTCFQDCIYQVANCL